MGFRALSFKRRRVRRKREVMSATRSPQEQYPFKNKGASIVRIGFWGYRNTKKVLYTPTTKVLYT